MKFRSSVSLVFGFVLIGTLLTGQVMAQRGRGGAGGGGAGGGRSAGHQSGGAGRQPNRSPSMSRPGGGAQGGMQRPGGNGMQRPGGNAGFERPGGNAGFERPGGNAGFERPGGNAGFERPGQGGERPGGAAGIQRPGGGGAGFQRPEGGFSGGRQGATSDQLSDFFGGQGAGRPGMQRPGDQPGLGERGNIGNRTNVGDRTDLGNRTNVGDRTNVGNRTNIGDTTNVGNRTNVGDRTNVGNRTIIGDTTNVGNRANVGDRTNVANQANVGDRTTNINVGDVNVGNRTNYVDNSQAWVSQRNAWGNDVRGNVGNRYGNVFNDSWYRRPYTGAGYNYWGGWANRGPNYAWSPAAWAGVGAFMGGALASAQPVYYGYGTGGNVYYENNVVYVNGQPSGTPQQYYQQTQAIAAAAPPVDQVNAQEEWLPLGVYAVTSEDAPEASAVLQLAVNKQGVLAGTMHDEHSKTDRPVQGKVDQQSQRAVMTFGDGKNSDIVLETGIYNLTKDEAPALLHFGADQSQPKLLVRLKPPGDQAAPAPPAPAVQ